jgi:inhibitor of KinA
MKPDYTIYPLGDSALIVDFGNIINEDVNKRVLHLFTLLQNALPFAIDIIPAYSSLTIYYDACALHTPTVSAFEIVKGKILPFLNNESVSLPPQRLIEIPVCYAASFAPDLAELAAKKQLSMDEVVRLHTAKTYRVYTIGFLPGFAYMGKVDEQLATPRRQQPRTQIPAGSVGIAGEQTGIYPLTSPGGWNIIGQTPLKLFDAQQENPVLLQPGDNIQFYSITEDEFANYQSRTA